MAVLNEAAAPTGAARLTGARRLVLKIGSALLVDRNTGEVRTAWLEALAADIAAARARGQDVAIVSSGAVALGRRPLGISRARPRLEESQAAAAIGQIRLARAWQEALEHHGLTCAQILVTFGATENRRQYLNARSTLETLFRLGAIPVINENDTVATLEIRYGDNDRLAARVAQMISADCLVLFSDVAGLYTADPRANPAAELVSEICAVDERIMAMATGPVSGMGSGGMVTKLQAGAIAIAAGCHMVIADGRVAHPLARIEGGAPCSWFVAQDTPRTARKQWIASMLKPAGTLHVDAGAVRALGQGRSLLPAGVRRVEGSFERGDAVRVLDEAGRQVARGLIAYDAGDAGRIAGHRSGDIADLLGYRGRDEMIHRDDLVLDAQEAGEGVQP